MGMTPYFSLRNLDGRFKRDTSVYRWLPVSQRQIGVDICIMTAIKGVFSLRCAISICADNPYQPYIPFISPACSGMLAWIVALVSHGGMSPKKLPNTFTLLIPV